MDNMDIQTTEQFKNLFQDLYNDTLANMEKAGQEVFVEQVKGDDVDISLGQRDQQLQIKLKGREAFFLKKIEQALDRISNGEFGLCEDCGQEISLERLKARPTASLCIHCKEEQEREENKVLYKKRSHTAGKELQNNNVIKLSSATEDIAKAKEYSLDKAKAKIGLVN